MSVKVTTAQDNQRLALPDLRSKVRQPHIIDDRDRTTDQAT